MWSFCVECWPNVGWTTFVYVASACLSSKYRCVPQPGDQAGPGSTALPKEATNISYPPSSLIAVRMAKIKKILNGRPLTTPPPPVLMALVFAPSQGQYNFASACLTIYFPLYDFLTLYFPPPFFETFDAEDYYNLGQWRQKPLHW